ncbi:MAG: MFS transporter [Zoogloeaceae bacterium]|jgi:MFS family permease|nr:MFS transporter [Zoogloeaceae bacterium]
MKNASWTSITLILAFAVLIAMCHGKSMILVSDFSQTFGVTPAHASWIVSAVALVAALASPVVTWLISLVGERRAIVFGLLTAGSMSLLGSQATLFPVLLVLRVLEGAGYISVVLACLALLVHTTEGVRRVRALAFWSVASPLGGAIAIFLVSPFVGGAWGGWRTVFGGHALILFALLILTPALPARNLTRQSERKTFAQVFQIYRNPSIIRLAAAVGAPLTVALGLVTVVPHYFLNVFQVRPETIGLVSTLGILSSVLAGGVAGYVVTSRVGGFAVVFGALAGVGLEILFFIPGIGVETGIAAKILQGFFGSFVSAWVFTNIPRMAPKGDVLGAGGIAEQFLYLSMFLGPLVLFPLYTLESRLPFFIALAVGNLLPLFLLPLGTRRKTSPQETEATASFATLRADET